MRERNMSWSTFGVQDVKKFQGSGNWGVYLIFDQKNFIFYEQLSQDRKVCNVLYITRKLTEIQNYFKYSISSKIE